MGRRLVARKPEHDPRYGAVSYVSYNRGCRCGDCTEARRVYQRDYLEARRRRFEEASDPEVAAVSEVVRVLRALAPDSRSRVLHAVELLLGPTGRRPEFARQFKDGAHEDREVLG